MNKEPIKIVFFGDSVTDANRNRDVKGNKNTLYGMGYVFLASAELEFRYPNRYEIYNRGVSGNRLPQAYARIQEDVWNIAPDVLSIFMGINDIPHSNNPNPTDLPRWTRLYRTMIEETKERCPNIKIIMVEPINLLGSATCDVWEERKAFAREYAAQAKKIANEYNIPFISLQKKFDEYSNKYGTEAYLYDGMHPNLAGAKVIADEWLKTFYTLDI